VMSAPAAVQPVSAPATPQGAKAPVPAKPIAG